MIMGSIQAQAMAIAVEPCDWTALTWHKEDVASEANRRQGHQEW